MIRIIIIERFIRLIKMQTQKTSPLNVVYNAIRSLHEDLVNVSFYPGDYEILIETFSKFYITHYYFWITAVSYTHLTLPTTERV